MFCTGPAARTPAETPKAVNACHARDDGASANRVPMQGQHLSRGNREEGPLEEHLADTLIGRVNKTDTLIERVDALIRTGKEPLEWGSPQLSTTPASLAVRELAAQIEALEIALREIALEVQKLSSQS
jgi:hypothetical protein